MRTRPLTALVLLAGLIAGCWQLKPNRCNDDSDCGGRICDLTTRTCMAADASVSGAGGAGGQGGAGGSRDGGTDVQIGCTATLCSGMTPICPAHEDGGVASCAACTDSNDCVTAHTTTGSACVTSGAMKGACVPCVSNSDCPNSKTTPTPVCDSTYTCEKCATDSDCPASATVPGVCMTDGHCADSSEVIFVQYSAAGCPNADGTAAKPFCTLGGGMGGVQALSTTKTALVIVGPANDQLTLATSGFSPLIVGRANAAMPGSIGASVAPAISVSSDNVSIRDLTVNGTTTSTNGIVATGAGTKLTLARVTTSVPKGLGIDAETGVTLTMSHCTVNGSGGGGILLNGAAFDIDDTTVTNNGPGSVPNSAATIGGIFVSNPMSLAPVNLKQVTVSGNMGPGIACMNAITGTGLLVYGNSIPQIGTNCGTSISTCGDAGTTTCGAQP